MFCASKRTVFIIKSIVFCNFGKEVPPALKETPMFAGKTMSHSSCKPLRMEFLLVWFCANNYFIVAHIHFNF